MKPPTDFQISQLEHIYDPIKAHEYYMRVRKLKGRRKGSEQPPPSQSSSRQAKQLPPHRKVKGTLAPKEAQKAKLKANIQSLEGKLHHLEELIRKKEATLTKDHQNAKSTAKKNHKSKQQSAADKAKASKKYRQSHKQQLKNKAKTAASKKGGGSHGTKGAHGKNKPDAKKSIAELKALATKVKGQLAIAKQKLAAL